MKGRGRGFSTASFQPPGVPSGHTRNPDRRQDLEGKGHGGSKGSSMPLLRLPLATRACWTVHHTEQVTGDCRGSELAE